VPSVSIREDHSGSVAAYTVGIFVSLAVYIVPMALLALTRIANRAGSEVLMRAACSFCCHFAGRHALLCSAVDFYHAPEPRSEVSELKATRIQLRLDAKVFAAPLGRSRNEPERGSRMVSRKLSHFVDVAFVPSGIGAAPASDVGAVASLIVESAFVPADLRHDAWARNLVPEEHSTSYPALPRLPLAPDRRKRREPKRRVSGPGEDDSTALQACDAKPAILASGRQPTATLPARRGSH
jgi:hypothetical protein